MPFGEIAPHAGGRTPARVLHARAQRDVTKPDLDLARQHQGVGAVLAAAGDGDFGAISTALDPDVVLRADSGALLGASRVGVISHRKTTHPNLGRAASIWL